MSELSTAAAVLAALADQPRLELFAEIGRRQARAQDCSTTTVAAALGRDLRAVLKDAVRLDACGVLTIDKGTLRIKPEALKRASQAIVASLPLSPLLAEEPDLARFFRYGRLVAIPDNPRYRERVAALIVKLLPVGRELTETEVNEPLRKVHDDHAALRRLLVDQTLLKRHRGCVYERSA